MGSRLPPRRKVPADLADESALVVLPEVDATAQDAVVDWRVALAAYLKALRDLGDPPPPADRER